MSSAAFWKFWDLVAWDWRSAFGSEFGDASRVDDVAKAFLRWNCVAGVVVAVERIAWRDLWRRKDILDSFLVQNAFGGGLLYRLIEIKIVQCGTENADGRYIPFDC